MLAAPSFDEEALSILQQKKNRILLRQKKQSPKRDQFRSLLNGVLTQNPDEGNYAKWEEKGGRSTTAQEKEDLVFANIVCKHLKSNAIALVKNKQMRAVKVTSNSFLAGARIVSFTGIKRSAITINLPVPFNGKINCIDSIYKNNIAIASRNALSGRIIFPFWTT